MITPEYVSTMARYNRWQNTNLVQSVDQLSAPDRVKDMGGFFGSIEQTCFHIVWGDSIWLSRFSDLPPPEKNSIADSVRECDDWADYRRRREWLDSYISRWADRVTQDQLDAELQYYSGAAGRNICKPVGLLVTHFFNHQTHHRGQVHAMLTALGAETQDTDMPLLPDEIT